MIDTTSLPLVTVVTPSYNQGRFIEETILSVLNQDYPNIEYLIIDGGSTDNTLGILKKYDGRLTWISEPDRGQSHAINKGFKMARGEILSWLNSDDFYEPGAIRAAVDYFISNQDVVMVYGEGNLIDEHANLIRRLPIKKTFDMWSLIYQLDNIVQPSTFFRNDVIKELGFLDESIYWCMDFEYWLRIGSRYKIGYHNFVFSNARIHSEIKSARGGVKRLYELFSVINKYRNNHFLPSIFMFIGGLIAAHLKFKMPKVYNNNKRIITGSKKFLESMILNYHGVYADGWLGEKARFMFPIKADSDTICFMLELPDHKQVVSNSVRAVSAGKTIATLAMVVPGRYELRLPYNRNTTKPTEIALYFSRSLPPDSQRRRLACKLVSVDFVF